MADLKKCSKCLEVKSVSDFGRNSGTKDGLFAWCKQCSREYAKKYAADNKHTERFKESKRRSESSQRARERQREYRERNREQVAERTRKWRAQGGARNRKVAVEKQCRCCGETKPFGQFTRCKDARDGLGSWCKRCVADRVKEYASKGEVRERRKAWHRSARGKASVAKYAASAKGKVSRAKRDARRRAAQEALEQTLTAAEWELILLLHGNACAYCHRAFGRDVKVTIDHKQPVARGGGTTKENIVPACTHCNSSKGARDWPKTMPDGTLAPQENA